MTSKTQTETESVVVEAKKMAVDEPAPKVIPENEKPDTSPGEASTDLREGQTKSTDGSVLDDAKDVQAMVPEGSVTQAEPKEEK